MITSLADYSVHRKESMKSNNRWDVVYETVDKQTNKTVEHFAARAVDWRSALLVKRNHKGICKMSIHPTTLAPDAANAADDRNFLSGLAIGLQNGLA